MFFLSVFFFWCFLSNSRLSLLNSMSRQDLAGYLFLRQLAFMILPSSLFFSLLFMVLFPVKKLSLPVRLYVGFFAWSLLDFEVLSYKQAT